MSRILKRLAVDHLWDEARFRRWYPGTDPNALTLVKYFGMIDLISRLWMCEAGKDVSQAIMREEAIRDIELRTTYGVGMPGE